MGGAHVAVSGDSESIFYNPAGIHERTEVSELSSMHTTLYGQKDMAYDYVAFLQPMMPFAVRLAVRTSAARSKGGARRPPRGREAALGVNLKSLRTKMRRHAPEQSANRNFGAILVDGHFQRPARLQQPARVSTTLPRTAKVGAAFRPVDEAALALSRYQAAGPRPVTARSRSAKCRVTPDFLLRASYVTGPARVAG
jgi:hypothetical protein